MTSVEIDDDDDGDDPLILINPLSYATMARLGAPGPPPPPPPARIRGAYVYDLNARFALPPPIPPAVNALLYLMLPSIAIVELLKLIPSTRARARARAIDRSG